VKVSFRRDERTGAACEEGSWWCRKLLRLSPAGRGFNLGMRVCLHGGEIAFCCVEMQSSCRDSWCERRSRFVVVPSADSRGLHG